MSSPSDLDRFVRRRDGSSSDRRFTDTADGTTPARYRFRWETVNAIGSSSTVSTTTATHANRVDPARKLTPPNAIRCGRLSYDKTRFCTRSTTRRFAMLYMTGGAKRAGRRYRQNEMIVFSLNCAYRCLSTR